MCQLGISQSIAPNWTATDLNGETHTLQDYLDDGKDVIIDFSATWCGPCWSYHQSGTLENMWDQYGPDGTDEIMIFYLESDFDTNDACIYGTSACNDNTYGDWTAGVHYPIINLTSSNGGNVWNQYGVPGFPTVAVISASNNTFYNLVGNGASTQATLESWVFNSFQMTMDGSVTDEECEGSGSISANVQNGAGGLTYTWSNGIAGNTSVAENLVAGNYALTVSDVNGYEVSENFTVASGPNPYLELSADQIDIDCFGNQNGSLVANAFGGDGSYDYQWSNGSSSSQIFDLPSGLYSLTVTDGAGCEVISEYDIFEPEQLDLYYEVENANCGDQDGSVYASGAGGSGLYTYELNGVSNTSGFFDNLYAGEYELYMVDESFCEQVLTLQIEETEMPAAQASTQGSISCENNTTVVSGEGSEIGNDILYEWTTNDGVIVSGASTMDATVSAVGTYILEVSNIITGCSETAETVVMGSTLSPEVAIAEAAALDCQNQETTLEGSSTLTGSDVVFNWTTTDGIIESGANTLTPTVSAGGTYVLTATNNANGCTDSEPVTVEANIDLPAVTVANATLTCEVNQVTLCAEVEAGSTARWTINGETIDALCADVDMSGTYMVEVTGANGCSTMASATVDANTSLPDVTVDEPAMLTCAQATVMLSAQLGASLDGHTITWSDANGNVIANSLTTEVGAAGTYTISVTENETGCTTTMMTSVESTDDLPEIAISAAPDLTCLITEVTVEGTVEGNAEDFNISWTNSAGESVGSELTVNVNAPDDYTMRVEHKVTAAIGTGEMENVTFDQNGMITICIDVTNDCGTDQHCEDYNYAVGLTFESAKANVKCADANDGSIAVTPSGGEGNYTVAWTGPNGFTSDQLTIDGLEAGTYSMMLEDSYGYMQSNTYEVAGAVAIELVSEDIAMESAEGAEDGSVTVEITGGAGEYIYLWSNGSTDATLTGVATGEYTVDVTDENGCTTTFGPFEVSRSVGLEDISFANAMDLYPVPAVNRLYLDMTLVKNTSVSLNITNAQGQLISQRVINSATAINETFDVSALDAGIYFLHITDGAESTTERFMVIR